jgi:hypothetical protein
MQSLQLKKCELGHRTFGLAKTSDETKDQHGRGEVTLLWGAKID